MSSNGRSTPLSLHDILNPSSLAVIGASDDQKKFGGRMFSNILHGGFSGQVVPVNPRRDTILGAQAYPEIGEVPFLVDVAVVAVPVEYAERSVQACAAAGVGCCVIITAGFSEVGARGAAVQQRLVDIAREANMRLIGPNCLGFVNTHARLLCNSSPSMKVTPLVAGGIGHVSQSGALMATLYNRGVDDKAAYSVSVSVGNQADLDLADFVDFFAYDPNTRVITAYVEGFRDAGRFFDAVRRCRAAGKPVLMVKSGLTESGAQVTRSHTASLASNAAVIEAVCREAGVILVDDPRGMLQAAELYSRHGPPTGDGICVISGSGGAAAVTADKLAQRGLRLATWSATTQTALEQIYEPTQLGNPLDVGAMRDKSFVDVDDGGLGIAADDADVSLILAPITTAPMIGGVTRHMAMSSLAAGKPALFVIVQGTADDGARDALAELDMLYYETLDEALRVIACWMRGLPSAHDVDDTTRADDIVNAIESLEVEHEQLTEPETKRLVQAYGIPICRETTVQTVEEAIAAASKIGYPVALKVVDREHAHKTEIDGVRLGINNEHALALAFDELRAKSSTLLVSEMVTARLECLVGLKYDTEFGCVVAFGLGGTATELLNDVCLTPAPVSAARAKALLRGLKLWPLLDGARGTPKADVDALADVISRLSWLGVDAGSRLLELDLNPVLIDEHGVTAVDASARLQTGRSPSTVTR